MKWSARRTLVLAGLLLLLASTPSQASLLLLDDGTVLDTDLGVAFLQDMNAAMSMGYDADGRMAWSEAMAWIDHLNAVAYLGYSDWLLAGGSGEGSGFPLRTQANYLEHLIYGELGNARPSPGGTLDPGALDLGPFLNLGTGLGGGYWVWPELAYDGLADPACAGEPLSGCYSFSYRILDDRYDGDPVGWSYHSTAMRRVNVAEPGSFWLLAAGAAAWGARSRFRRGKR